LALNKGRGENFKGAGSMKKRVLLVEDARDVQLIVKASINDVCEVGVAETVAEAEAEMKKGDYSLILLDIHLPDESGMNFCRQLREQKKYEDIPIIFLTSEDRIESKVLGFEAGADDYITKPFDTTELRARVLSRLRRNGKKTTDPITRIGEFAIDFNRQKISDTDGNAEGKPLPLTPIEFKLLVHFLQNDGKIYSRQELLETFWGGDVHVSKHTIDTHISSLRKKLGEKGSYLRSVFRRGYLFNLPPPPAKQELSETIAPT
jgi:DNA-binding response OmpR family regulator